MTLKLSILILIKEPFEDSFLDLLVVVLLKEFISEETNRTGYKQLTALL